MADPLKQPVRYPMRSPQLARASYISNLEKPHYSELQVLKSAAGWYFGTIYTDPEDGFQEPGSRDSPYYSSEEEATYALTYLENYVRDADTPDKLAEAVHQWELQMINLGHHQPFEGYRWNP